MPEEEKNDVKKSSVNKKSNLLNKSRVNIQRTDYNDTDLNIYIHLSICLSFSLSLSLSLSLSYSVSVCECKLFSDRVYL